MNLERVEKIAEAVLYEGYMLYPYRPSSVKNQQRWNFGVLYPESYCEGRQGSDTWRMQTECLVKTTASTRLTVEIRFLQTVRRFVGKLRTAGGVSGGNPDQAEPEFELVQRLEIGDRVYRPWQEAVERKHIAVQLHPANMHLDPIQHFSFPAGRSLEILADPSGRPAGVIVREWESLAGSIELAAKEERDGIYKITVLVSNQTPLGPALDAAANPIDDAAARDQGLMHSLVSAHTILGLESKPEPDRESDPQPTGEMSADNAGEFISLLEIPAGLEDLAAQCKNVGAWPVLVGDNAGEPARLLLSSPIILYDYPQIAPESPGNLFDATEIDEILSLRILTLTDAEKQEMRQSDDRAREILERTESMPEEQFLKLHGALRGLSPRKQQEAR